MGENFCLKYICVLIFLQLSIKMAAVKFYMLSTMNEQRQMQIGSERMLVVHTLHIDIIIAFFVIDNFSLK